MKRKSFFDWLQDYGVAIQSFTAVLTVLIALGALIGVKVQVDAAKKMQLEQSARDIYREYLSLSISQPQFSRPDYCNMVKKTEMASYENFVEYLIYTAEQNIKADANWLAVFEVELSKHSQYICSIKNWENLDSDTSSLIENVKKETCHKLEPCAD